jgi:hypothetical protein
MVFARLKRQTIAASAILAMLGFAVLPAEHIHVARTHDGHHSDVVHRHFESHHLPRTDTRVGHVDDDDEVQWLTNAFAGPNSLRYAPPRVEPAIAPSIPDPPLTVRRAIQPLFVSVHDPPWTPPSGLRAPPAFLI